MTVVCLSARAYFVVLAPGNRLGKLNLKSWDVNYPLDLITLEKRQGELHNHFNIMGRFSPSPSWDIPQRRPSTLAAMRGAAFRISVPVLVPMRVVRAFQEAPGLHIG